MKNLNGVSYSYDQDSNISFLWYDQDYLYDSIEYGRLYHYYSYNYDDADGSLTSVSININGYPNTINAVLNYAYDGFGRYTSKSIATSGGTNTTSFGYLTNGSATSSLVSQYTSTIIKDEIVKYNKTFNYVYDDANMNITEVRDANNNILYKYTYDELDRLVREDNYELGKTFVYTYDDNGNILCEKIYSYTLDDVSTITPMHTYEYSYKNENWKDQLTGYNGGTITYDEVGNPLSYWNGMNFTWENINNLSNISLNEKNISYEYNDEGIRTSKTVNGVTHTYVLEGSKILSEAYGDVLLVYLYDESDAPIGLLYRESSYAEEVFDEYYFTKNLQGDIIGIYDNTGKIVVEYSYDAWGELYSYSYYPESEHIAEINPFRYRGYYFDQETGFYYLNSRYYDPDVKRFISADDIYYLGANGDLQAYNIYAYCSDNPIKYIDATGNYTRTVSIGVNATALFGISFSLGFSYDHHGNMAFSFSYALPNYDDTMYIGGLDAGVSISEQHTVLDNVDELAGKSMYVGGSGGYMGYFGGDLVALPDNYEGKGIGGSSWIGAQASVGLGIGADAHIMQTNTVQTKSFNPIKSLVNWVCSWFD